MEQQFSLTWKNFHGNLSDGFSDLLGNGDFVDVTLACEGHLLQAHKVVLSICSPYFKRMFQLNPCQHPIVVLRDISYRAMKDLIHFMYNGEVNVRQEDLAGFINTAETLQIKGLTNKHTDDEPQENASPKVTSPITPVINNTIAESNPDSTNVFSEELSHVLENTQNQLELINSLRLAHLKRKSEEFLANNFNMGLNEKNHPEKKIKLREKHILNRHKISAPLNRSPSTESHESKQVRNEAVSTPPNNIFNSNKMIKMAERNIPFVGELKTGHEANGRSLNSVTEDVKQEKEEENDSEDQTAHKTTNGLDHQDKSLDMTSPRLEHEDGAHVTTVVGSPATPILRASWPISQQNRKLTSSPVATGAVNANGPSQAKSSSPSKSASSLPTASQILSNIQSSLAHLPVLNNGGQTQHTIITIPQKEDGKKKYPQRSCRFCWRKAGKRRDTRFMCMECCVPLCKSSCFELHQSEGFMLNFKEDNSTAVL